MQKIKKLFSNKKMRLISIAVVIIVPVSVFTLFFLYSPSVPLCFCGNSDALVNTRIVPALDTPFGSGKNIIWCASFQGAWKKLQGLAGGPVRLAGAEETCAKLNSAFDPASLVSEDSWYADAGWVDKGIVETVTKEMKDRFPAESPPKFPGIIKNGFLAFSYLEAELRFGVPYFNHAEPVLFRDSRGNTTGIQCFGFTDGNSYEEAREQIDVLYVSKENAEVPDEFILDLDRNSDPYQLIVACIKPCSTLEETVAHMKSRIQEYSDGDHYPERIGPMDSLYIPLMFWRITHHFKELERKQALNRTLKNRPMDAAVQMITFRLDKGGAKLKSLVKMYPKCASEKDYILNKPFLIYMGKRNADNPFFVMWIDNAELLYAGN